MAASKKISLKVRRARVVARIPVALRDRLFNYCASTGQSERLVLERALEQTLDRETDTARMLKRFDQLERALHEQGRDLQLLSEVFGRYLRLWLLAHDPHQTRDAKEGQQGRSRLPTASENEMVYRKVLAGIGRHFFGGHRFIDDLPPELVAAAREDPASPKSDRVPL